MNFKRINNIISETINSLINEAVIVNDEKLKFKTNINNSTFFDYESFSQDYDSEVAQSNITVSWGVSFWVNESGIENFIVDVESVQGIFILNLFDKQSQETVQQAQKNIEDFEWKFILNEPSVSKGNSLYVSGLEFDFKLKTCKVSF